MKLKYLLVVLGLVVSSCALAPQPRVSMEKGATLGHYKVFDVLPAQNETGKTFDVDVAAILTEQLISKLRAKNYTVNPGGQEPQDVLMLRSSVVRYEPGGAMSVVPGAAFCTVRTALIDKKTGRLLGEMVTTQEVRTGGFLLGGLVGAVGLVGADKQILDTIAAGIVDELEQRISQDQTKVPQ